VNEQRRFGLNDGREHRYGTAYVVVSAILWAASLAIVIGSLVTMDVDPWLIAAVAVLWAAWLVRWRKQGGSFVEVLKDPYGDGYPPHRRAPGEDESDERAQ